MMFMVGLYSDQKMDISGVTIIDKNDKRVLYFNLNLQA